jgi:hypothetical protein
MPLTNPNKVVTEERLSEFYGQILPYMGGMPDVLANKFSKGDLYSTDEKMIGCYVDGKPLYQKVTSTPIDFTTFTPTGQAEFADDTTNFVGSGNASNYSIQANALDLICSIPATSDIQCKVPFHTGQISITVTQTAGTAVNFAGYILGSTQGASDIASHSWGSFGVNTTQTFTIDLSQYQNSDIYLSLRITVKSGNNCTFRISSILGTIVQYDYSAIVIKNSEIKDAMDTTIAYLSRYTKTTDSPIAIGSDTDYSTDEKIVGTWIDGKPIWQKCFVVNTTTTVNNLVSVDGFTSVYTSSVLPTLDKVISIDLLSNNNSTSKMLKPYLPRLQYDTGQLRPIDNYGGSGINYEVVKDSVIVLQYTKTS